MATNGLLQEDFAFHDLVVAHSPFAHLVRGNPAWIAAPLFQGAGLTILSHFATTETARDAYGVCNGWLSAANDCFGHKGFVMARLALPDGAAIDAWNTHLDAGDTDADRAVRADQLERLAAAIETQSADRASSSAATSTCTGTSRAIARCSSASPRASDSRSPR